MDPVRALHRHVLIPAFETVIKRRSIFPYYHALEKSQWLSPSALRQRQLESLRVLLNHAERFCPYYRETWSQRGLQSSSLQSLEDFESWPVLRRGDVQRERRRMQSSQPGTRLLPKATGGSSGAPVQFDVTPESYDRRFAAWYRGYSWSGATPGTRQLYLWGVPTGQLSMQRRVKEDLYHRLYRRRIFNTFQLSEKTIPRFVTALNRYRPEVLVAYTGPLYAVARALEVNGIRPFSPNNIVVGAEKLHEFQRETIERVFRAAVFETYGSREFMLIAAECERREGLHLTAENLVVEIVDDDGQKAAPGVEGNIVVTDLFNFGMPFIRYDTGDRGVAMAGPCGCGRGLPRLQKIVGRRLDVLTTPDGRHVPGEFFPHLIKDFPAIANFQVVQTERHCIEVKLVTPRGWAPEDEQRLQDEIRGVIGEVVRLELRRVPDIPLSPAGKRQVVVNRCAQPTTV